MKIEKYICELLYQHDCVIVPGFGAFITNYNSAKIHPVQHEFFPPSKVIAFNSNIINNDGLLANFIADIEKISFIDALNLIKEQVNEFSQTLANTRRIEFAGLGILFYDAEQHLQFEPDRSHNFLIASYGLQSFISPAILRPDFKMRIERKLKDRPIISPERRSFKTIYKVAAITIPAAVLIFWGVMNFKTVEQTYSNYSGFIPSFRSAEKPAIKAVQGNRLALESKDIRRIVITRSVTDEIKNDTTANTENKITNENSNSTEKKYFVIGGCFKLLSNAENFVNTLQNKGYQAQMTGQNENGLYRVSYGGFNDEPSARQLMNKIKSSENPAAWLFENK